MKKYVAVFMSALCLLTACGSLDVPSGLADLLEPIPEEESRIVYDNDEVTSKESDENHESDISFFNPADFLEYAPADDMLVEEESVSDEDAKDECIVYSDEKLGEIMTEQEGYYYYDKLTAADKKIYAQIVRALQEFDEKVEVSTLDPSVIERVFQCVMNDHPEIFYIQGFTYIKYTMGDELMKIAFTGTTTMSEVEKDARMSPIRQYTAAVMRTLSEDMDDYEKIKAVYQFIVEHTEYDAHSIDNQNICSVFLYGRSVCQGYAKAMQYLLREAGVEATLVLGTVQGGQGHAWNLVKSDGEYYYVDVTWGDASYRSSADGQREVKYRPSINYDYLCVTTEQICRTHQVSSVVKMPICVAIKDNYYNREGALFNKVDEEQLSTLFGKGYETQTPYVTLKCSTKAVYDAMVEYLINEQHIFKYLSQSGGSVNYTNDDTQWSMSFWL